MIQLPQTFIGQVNVVGECYCYGLVQHLKAPAYKYIPVFINITGAASSVEALWAKLAQGKPALVIRGKGEANIPLEPDDQGLYVRYQKKIEGLGIDHLLLVHRSLSEPEYPTSGDPVNIYSFWLNDELGIAKLGEHVRKSVKIAVFEEWYPFLNTEGRRFNLIQPLTSYGEVKAVQITLDPKRWTQLIADGLKNRRIAFPS